MIRSYFTFFSVPFNEISPTLFEIDTPSNYVCRSHISIGMISFFISTVDLFMWNGNGNKGWDGDKEMVNSVLKQTIYSRVNICLFFFVSLGIARKYTHDVQKKFTS